MNNKVHTATKVSPFMANYRRELRMGGDIRRKGKVESVMEFVQRMKKGSGGSRSGIEENSGGDEEICR